MQMEINRPDAAADRLCLYVLRDPDGLVDEITVQTLAALRTCCRRLLVLSTAPLTDAAMSRLKAVGTEVAAQTSAAGSGVTALLAAALGALSAASREPNGWVLITGDWLLGPVRPLEPLLARLDGEKAPLWGLSQSQARFSRDGRGFQQVEPYLQGYFYALRPELLDPLARYWAKRPAAELPFSETAAMALTHFAESRGWRRQALLPSGPANRLDPFLLEPAQLIREADCPFFSPEVFCCPYDRLLAHSAGDQGRQLLRLLEELDYPTELLWRALLRRCHLSDLHRTLGLFRVLPEAEAELPPLRSALILHLHYEELFVPCCQAARSMPAGSDLFITTTSEEKREQLLPLLENGPWNKVEVRVIPNRGRDVAALLAGCADVPAAYDCVCFAHDKRSHQREALTHGADFSAHCLDNILGSRELVSQALACFAREPQLGLLFPPPPCHGGFIKSIDNEWTSNYDASLALARELELHVPMDEAHEPIAPLGTMFWFRPPALKKLLERGWDFSDFPPEPNDSDGTLLHAIERLYPFVAQDAAYYSAWCIGEDQVSRYALNLYQSLQASRKTLYDGRPGGLLLPRLKRRLKRVLPKGLWRRLRSLYLGFKGLR